MRNKYEIRGDTTAIFLNRKNGEILETLVDTADLDFLLKFPSSWRAVWNGRTKSFYACGNKSAGGRKKTTISLSRILLDTPKHLQADHINHDTLNNKRSNIRNVTVSENLANRRPYKVTNRNVNQNNLKPTKKIYKDGIWGINLYWDEKKSKYRVQARTAEGKYKSFGYFSTKEEAQFVASEIREKKIS